MIRSWVSANYLGHTNLKEALDSIKRSIENVAVSAVDMTLAPTTMPGFGIGGYLRLGTSANSTFMYRIEDTFYIKGSGAASAVATGDTTPSLLPHDTSDNTAAGGYEITAGYYRAGVVLIDANGRFSVHTCETQAGRTDGVSSGGRLRALSYLAEELTTDDLEDKAIVSFFVIGDGSNAFTSTSSLTISTNIDIYNCGGMALSSGLSTDGNQILGLL